MRTMADVVAEAEHRAAEAAAVAFEARLHAARLAEEERTGHYRAGPSFWLAEVRRKYPDFGDRS